MPRSPSRPTAAALCVGLLALGIVTDTSLRDARVRVCPDGARVTAPAPCPPPGTLQR